MIKSSLSPSLGFLLKGTPIRHNVGGSSMNRFSGYTIVGVHGGMNNAKGGMMNNYGARTM